MLIKFKWQNKIVIFLKLKSNFTEKFNFNKHTKFVEQKDHIISLKINMKLSIKILLSF